MVGFRLGCPAVPFSALRLKPISPIDPKLYPPPALELDGKRGARSVRWLLESSVDKVQNT